MEAREVEVELDGGVGRGEKGCKIFRKHSHQEQINLAAAVKGNSL